MGDYTKKLAKKTDGKLLPGETLLAAVRALPPGGVMATSISAAGVQVGGAVGMMAAEKIGEKLTKKGEQTAEQMDFPLAKQMVLGLTDRRLTVWNRSLWLGKPKDIIGEVPLERLASLEATPGKLNHKIAFTLVDGSSITLDIVKIDGYETFVNAFNSMKGGGSPTALAV